MLNSIQPSVAFKGNLTYVGESGHSIDYMYATQREMDLNSKLNEMDNIHRHLVSTLHPEDTVEINYDESCIKYIPGEKSLNAGLKSKKAGFKMFSYFSASPADFVHRAEQITDSIYNFITTNTEQLTKRAIHDNFLGQVIKNL